MNVDKKHTIRLGEYQLFGLVSHLVITGHDETGAQIWELNGLAVDKNDKARNIGRFWDGSDTIKGYLTDYPVMGHKVVNQVPILIGTAQEIEGYRARAQSVIDRIDTRDLDYRVDRQNSNSLVGTVLNAFGIRPQELLNSPKHSFNKPVPGFTTDLLNDDDEKGGVREGNGIESSAFREAQGFNVDRQSAPVPKAKPRNASARDGSLPSRQIIPGARGKLSPTELQEHLKPPNDLSPAPIPPKKPKRKERASEARGSFPANPFDLDHQQLRQQADMLENNPHLARQMILAAGRDPKMFRL